MSFCLLMSVRGIGHYIPKVKSAIEAILRLCNKVYSQALLTSSKTTIGMLLFQFLALEFLYCVICANNKTGATT